MKKIDEINIKALNIFHSKIVSLFGYREISWLSFRRLLKPRNSVLPFTQANKDVLEFFFVNILYNILQ